MSLKEHVNKNQRTHEKGFVSFTEEDLNEAAVNNQANAEAYGLLDAAMRTSSHLTEEDRNGDSVTIDDIYPCTEVECDEMDALLDKAERAAADKNDSFFRERLGELRDIVAWSRKKHWTFKWSLIAGCVLAIFGMMYLQSDAEQTAANKQGQVAKVEAWTEQDTTIAYEASPSEYIYNAPMHSANAHKANRLAMIKHRVVGFEERIADYQNQLDTCTIEAHRKGYEANLKDNKESMEKARKEYDKVNDMDFADYKKMVLKDMQASADNASSHSSWMYFWLVYVIILIPAYIFYSHQYGYNITRHRTEMKVLGGIQKVFFGIAAFFLGSGLAMSLLPDYEVTTIYGDGHKEKSTESNPMNFVILAIKFVMMFIGLLIFAITSVFIMTYVTIMAIKRDHDWAKVSAAVAAQGKKAMKKVKESGVADKAVEMAKTAADKATEAAKEASEKVQEKMKK